MLVTLLFVSLSGAQESPKRLEISPARTFECHQQRVDLDLRAFQGSLEMIRNPARPDQTKIQFRPSEVREDMVVEDGPRFRYRRSFEPVDAFDLTGRDGEDRKADLETRKMTFSFDRICTPEQPSPFDSQGLFTDAWTKDRDTAGVKNFENRWRDSDPRGPENLENTQTLWKLDAIRLYQRDEAPVVDDLTRTHLGTLLLEGAINLDLLSLKVSEGESVYFGSKSSFQRLAFTNPQGDQAGIVRTEDLGTVGWNTKGESSTFGVEASVFERCIFVEDKGELRKISDNKPEGMLRFYGTLRF